MEGAMTMKALDEDVHLKRDDLSNLDGPITTLGMKQIKSTFKGYIQYFFDEELKLHDRTCGGPSV